MVPIFFNYVHKNMKLNRQYFIYLVEKISRSKIFTLDCFFFIFQNHFFYNFLNIFIVYKIVNK